MLKRVGILVLLLNEAARIESLVTLIPSRASIHKHSKIVCRSQIEHMEPAPTVPVVDDAEEMKYKAHIKELCAQRNLPFTKIKNCRDLASVHNSPIKSGHVYRTGRLGDATDKDKELLNSMKITTLVDLRSSTELKDDPVLMSDVFTNYTNLVWVEGGRGQEGCVRELSPGVSPIDRRRFRKRGSSAPDAAMPEAPEDELCDYGCDDPESMPAETFLEKKPSRKERHFVSLMNEIKYVKGTASKVRKRDITKSILKAPGAIVSRRIWDSVKRPFIRTINDGGLTMLNDLLLRYAAPGIRYVLELCANKERHPIAFYCTAGKDRTGIIAAIILSVCGVSPEDIVEDYSLSADVYAEMNDHTAMVGALSQHSLDPKTFLGAPPEVMADTLQLIEDNFGSVEGYCDTIGFGPEQREKLRQALLS